MATIALPINLIAHDEKGHSFLIGKYLRFANYEQNSATSAKRNTN